MMFCIAILPYLPKEDDWIGLTLILCLVISAFFIKRTHATILQQILSFATRRERGSFFNEQNESSVYAFLWYQLQAIITVCIAVYLILFDWIDIDYLIANRYFVLGGMIATGFFYLIIKRIIYFIYGWTLIGMDGFRKWLASYRLIISVTGLLFLSFDFFAIYVTFSSKIVLIICLLVWILVKITTLYAWIKLFSLHSYGVLLIILYFCTIEMLPYYVLYRIAFEY